MHQTNNKRYPKVRMVLPWRQQKAKAGSVGMVIKSALYTCSASEVFACYTLRV